MIICLLNAVICTSEAGCGGQLDIQKHLSIEESPFQKRINLPEGVFEFSISM
jgi:hypothetical protein